MKTLHCLYRTPPAADTPDRRPALDEGDAVLLLGTAACDAGNDRALQGIDGSVAIFVLEEDLRAHGVTPPSQRVTVVDYAGWLRLTETYPLQCVWD